MKSSALKIVLLMLVAVGAFACVAPVEEDTTRDRTLAIYADMDAEGAWALYDWYLEQGETPCDPPPDPWHPFVKYGCCGNEEIQRELSPTITLDSQPDQQGQSDQE